ncbi:MAG: hypothetical protein WCK58_02740 [Chloroflexota bacterium]
MTADPDLAKPRVAILADDLIWATRLTDLVRRAGAEPVAVRDATRLAAVLPDVEGCVVDCTARAYDGTEALAAASAASVPAVAVAQHDDAPLRRAAKAAGAVHVYAYRALHEHGDRDLGAWISGLRAAREETR